MVLNKKLSIPGIRELIQITINQKDWKSRTPLQKWSYLYGIGRACFLPLGFATFQDDQTIPWYAYLISLFPIVYHLVGAYTIFYHINKGEFLKCLPSTCLQSIIITAIPFLVVGLTNARCKLHSLLIHGGKYIYPNHNDDSDYNRICSENIGATLRNIVKKMLIINFSFCCAAIWPAHEFFVNNVKITPTELKFPFVADESTTEFIINTIFEIIIGYLGVLSYVGIELGMAFVSDVASISPKLVENELKQFDAMVENKRLNELKIRYNFNTIVEQALSSDDFLITLRDVGYYRSLITPPAFIYAIGMSIFSQYAMNYVSGYSEAGIAYVQLYYMCDLGDKVEDNGFDEVLYNSKWYNLPIKCQMDMMLLVNRKQQSVKYTVGPFGVINHELTAVITKKIYSFVMFLLNFTS